MSIFADFSTEFIVKYTLFGLSKNIVKRERKKSARLRVTDPLFLALLLYRNTPPPLVAGWLGGWVAGWAGWLDGWLAGWLDGWMAGWLHG
jgi:hypothetical protein